jgi:hypothetical protein
MHSPVVKNEVEIFHQLNLPDMYIRLVNFKAAPGKRSEVDSIADKFTPLIKAKPGNKVAGL